MCRIEQRKLHVADNLPVPPKAKGRRNRETIKPISGLDVDALLGELGEDTKGQVSAENAVPDFKRAMATADEISDIQAAAKQMGDIVQSFVTDSFGDSKYAQAVECIGVMREELINMEEPEMYNNFVRELKKGLLSGALGGDRRDFWFKVRWSRLGLIEQSQSDVSTVTADEADEVSSREYALFFWEQTLTSPSVLQISIVNVNYHVTDVTDAQAKWLPKRDCVFVIQCRLPLQLALAVG